jgi:hypothetical protein
MTDPTPPMENAEGAQPAPEQAIREKVRELTAQLLAGEKLDTDGVKEVVRALSGGAVKPALDDAQARAAFIEVLRELDLQLQASSQAAHAALASLAERGTEFSDNDLKNAFAALQKMQADFVTTAKHVADAASGNMQHELLDLALHAQRVGADASVRVAQMMSEFANRVNTSYRQRTVPGLEAARGYGVNVTLFTSGLLAGVADAMRQQAESRKSR